MLVTNCCVVGNEQVSITRLLKGFYFLQVEKSKTNPGYPLLLPKSNIRVSVPHSALTNSCQVNCQVIQYFWGQYKKLSHVAILAVMETFNLMAQT